MVAAGAGSRFGGSVPKQYEALLGRRVLDWSLAAARAVGGSVVLVVAPERTGEPEAGADVVVAGGATRSASVRAGLAAVPPEVDVVLVHDAARPLASAELFGRVVAAVRAGADAVVPAVALTDTVKQVEPGAAGAEGGDELDGARVVATPDRSRLVAVQTPQGFARAVLERAHADGAEASDDAALVERDGGRVVTVRGEQANLKVTQPTDLVVAELLLGRLGVGQPGVGQPGGR